MKNYSKLYATAVVLLTVAACNQPDTHDADVTAIKANEVQWVQDFAAKDTDKIVAHYADDATFMATGEPATSGIDAIRAAIKGMVADPAMSLQFQSSKVWVAKSGDLGVTQGTYTLAMTDPQTKKVMNDHGSYVTAFRKQADGSWKAVSDIVTSEVPPPAPAPAAAPDKKAKKKK